MGGFLFYKLFFYLFGYVVLMCYLCKIIFCFSLFCGENGVKINNMKNYKIIDECDSAFQNYNLTELAVIKKNGRKSLGGKISVQSVMHSLLNDYGVFVTGGTWLKDLNGDEFSDGDQLIYTSINQEFPIENEEILRQMYGYNDATINIGLYLGTGEDCAYSFEYNLNDFSCVFLRHYWGSNTEIEKFDTLKGLLEYLQTYKAEE